MTEENGYPRRIQADLDYYAYQTLPRKRSDSFYKMNHLTRLGNPEADYAHGILRRGKRTGFSKSEYFSKNMKDIWDEIEAKEALLKGLDKLGEDARITLHYYQNEV